MPALTHIKTWFFILSFTLFAIPACRGASSSDEPTAITCEPGMTHAAHQGTCIDSPCGNGALDVGEVCDDGNRVAGDGCSVDCQSNEACGNGVVDLEVGEICDDGNTQAGDQCCGDCRSCPEQAVPSVKAHAKRDASTVIPCSLVSSPPSLAQVSPAAGDVQFSRVRHDSSRACGAHDADRQQPQFEAQARLLIEQTQARMNEELDRARESIISLERTNAELRRSLSAERQQLVELRQRLASGRSIALQ